jgi:hypothetical protein
MAYDPYTDARTLDWSWEAMCALWRERALHQAEAAARWKRIAEAATTASTKEPSL